MFLLCIQTEAKVENSQAAEHLMYETSYDHLDTNEKRFTGIRLPKIKPIQHMKGRSNGQVKKEPFEPGKFIAFGGCPDNFDLDDLLSGSAELLGVITYGTSYKTILDDGTTLLVNRLTGVKVNKREFERRMEIAQMVSQHPNVMPPFLLAIILKMKHY